MAKVTFKSIKEIEKYIKASVKGAKIIDSTPALLTLEYKYSNAIAEIVIAQIDQGEFDGFNQLTNRQIDVYDSEDLLLLISDISESYQSLSEFLDSKNSMINYLTN